MVVEVVGGGRKEEELPNAGPTPKEERSGGDNEPVRSRFRLPVCMCRNIDLLKKKKNTTSSSSRPAGQRGETRNKGKRTQVLKKKGDCITVVRLKNNRNRRKEKREEKKKKQLKV